MYTRANNIIKERPTGKELENNNNIYTGLIQM